MSPLLKIPSLKRRCSQCGEKFVPGVTYTSTLWLDKEVQRKDYCHACWSSLEGPFPLWWQAEVAPVHAQEVVSQEDTELYRKFLRIYEENPDEKEMLYFLANYFQRRGRFKKKGEALIEEVSCTVFEESVSGDTFLIPHQILGSIKIEQIRKALSLCSEK